MHKNENELDFEVVGELGSECFVLLIVSGGRTQIEQVQKLLRTSVNKVRVNTEAYARPKLATEIAARFGVQGVMSGINVRQCDSDWIGFSHAGQRATEPAAEDQALEIEARGAGEILITSIDRDCTMKRYDLALIEKVVHRVNILVIASGGAANYQHIKDVVVHFGASAVGSASSSCFTEQTPASVPVLDPSYAEIWT